MAQRLELRWGTALLVVVGRHRQREMEQSLDVEPVHVYEHTWEETVNHAEAQGVKYMFVAMTPQEYSAQSIDDGTLPAVQHIHHNTGFTSWHGSFHDAVTYLLWCIATGVVAYTPVFYIQGDVCSQCTQGSHQFVPWLGQSFQQRLSQPDVPGWTCVHVRYYGAWIAESAQDPRQMDANSRALQLYQLVRLDSARASECAYSDQQASHWPSTCGPFYEPVPLRYGSCSTYGRWFTEGAATLHSSIHCTGEGAIQWGRELGISTDEGQSGSHEYGHLSHIGCHGHYGWWHYSWRFLKYKNWELRGSTISEPLLIHDVDTCE